MFGLIVVGLFCVEFQNFTFKSVALKKGFWLNNHLFFVMLK